MAMSGETGGSGGTRSTSGETTSREAQRASGRERQGEHRHRARVRRSASDRYYDDDRWVGFLPPYPYWGYSLLRGSLDAAYDIADNVAYSVERTSQRLHDDRGYFSPRRHWRDRDWYDDDVSQPFVRPISGSPPIVEETDDAYIVEVDTPGVHPDDVAVEIRGRRLFVSAERRQSDSTIRSWSSSRRRQRSFDIEWTVPTNADRDGIEATVHDGVLTLYVPKVWGEGPPTRVIPVRAADPED